MNYTTILPIAKLRKNDGKRIPGLPANPRFIKDASFEKLKKSIVEHGEFLDLKPILVYPIVDEGTVSTKHHDTTTYVVIGGNMRYEALKALKISKVRCTVIPVDTPIEDLRAYVLLDNSSFGRYDYDMLANEWDVDLLDAVDIDLPKVDDDIDDAAKDDRIVMKFSFSAEQAEFIKATINKELRAHSDKCSYYDGNADIKANALYFAIKSYHDNTGTDSRE